MKRIYYVIISRLLYFSAFAFLLSVLIPGYAIAEKLHLNLKAPEKPYIVLKTDIENSDEIYVYPKASPDIYSLIFEKIITDEEVFMEKYELRDFIPSTQYDVSFNGGDWQYEQSWDSNEGYFSLSDMAKSCNLKDSFVSECPFYISNYESFVEKLSFLPGFVYKDKNDISHFNLRDNYIAVRYRYIVGLVDEEGEYTWEAGPWSETSYLGGKYGTDTLPRFAGFMLPPTVSVVSIDGNKVVYATKNDTRTYDVMVYNTLDNGTRMGWQEAEYKINDGEWRHAELARPDLIYDGPHTFEAESTISEGDTVSVRSKYYYYLKNVENSTTWGEVSYKYEPRKEETQSQPAEQQQQYQSKEQSQPQTGAVETGSVSANTTNVAGKACLFGASFCCMEWYGYSACIWAIGVVVIIVLLLVFGKSRKGNEDEE